MNWRKSTKLGMFFAVFALPALTAPADETGVMVEAGLAHDSMEMRIGWPAIIEPGQPYPVLSVENKSGDELELRGGILRLDDGTTDQPIAPQRLAAGETARVAFEGAPGPGRYRVQLTFKRGGEEVFTDAYYFTAGLEDLRAHLPEGENYSKIVFPGEDGRLVYIPDYRGNRIPDFSRAGYMGGGVALPQVPVKVTLEPEDGDNRARIQAAIDGVSALDPDQDGIRGAVLLKKGVYEVSGPLDIRADGVVLRGEGAGPHSSDVMLKRQWLDPDYGGLDAVKDALAGEDATVLIHPARATRTGILTARGGGIQIDRETKTEIVDSYVPVGAVSFHIENPEVFSVGDSILVYRAANREWISKMGMRPFWSRGPRAFPNGWPYPMERTITAIDGHRITIDSPVVCAIEKRWGGGQIYRYDDSRRLSHVGFENMRVMLYSQLRGGRLSHMRGTAVLLENVHDGWVRDVVAEHCADRAFRIADSSRVTVQDSGVLLGGWVYSGYVPRYGFWLRGRSSNVLFEGCYANYTRHPFVVCAWVPGPNVFLNCRGFDNGSSGPHHRWSVGTLFDNVAVGNLEFRQRAGSGSGHGWAGGNNVAWNTSGRLRDSKMTTETHTVPDGRLICEQPPTAQNWSIGYLGSRSTGQLHGWNMRQFGYSFGYWESEGEHVKPESLYLRQLEDRLGGAR